MNKLPELDMYEFIDDGIHRSFYTILGSYLPELNGDFSTANLVNGIPTLKVTSGQELPYKKTYQRDVEKMIKLMLSKVDGPELFETSTNGRMSDEEFKRIFDELKASTSDNSDCKFFVTIKEFLDYATKHMEDPNTKPLRDSIVTNAMPYAEPEDVYNLRTNLLNTIYVILTFIEA